MGFRAWIRRTVFEGLSAGTYDTLSALQGKNTTSLPVEEAVAELFALMGSVTAAPVVGTPKDPGSAKQPLPLAGPRDVGHEEQPEAPRRGPGRPRKFQNPPGPEE